MKGIKKEINKEGKKGKTATCSLFRHLDNWALINATPETVWSRNSS
jgi:hypothetical protein